MRASYAPAMAVSVSEVIRTWLIRKRETSNLTVEQLRKQFEQEDGEMPSPNIFYKPREGTKARNIPAYVLDAYIARTGVSASKLLDELFLLARELENPSAVGSGAAEEVPRAKVRRRPGAVGPTEFPERDGGASGSSESKPGPSAKKSAKPRR